MIGRSCMRFSFLLHLSFVSWPTSLIHTNTIGMESTSFDMKEGRSQQQQQQQQHNGKKWNPPFMMIQDAYIPYHELPACPSTMDSRVSRHDAMGFFWVLIFLRLSTLFGFPRKLTINLDTDPNFSFFPLRENSSPPRSRTRFKSK